MFACQYGLPKARTSQALGDVGLADAANTPVSKLSTGMRQRLALARAILNHPAVLFLDEPTSGLDPGTALGIHQLILGLRDRGATVFLTTHNMDEAVRLCDQVALLDQGRIVEQGSAPRSACSRETSRTS